jgi:microcystin-dependent protein
MANPFVGEIRIFCFNFAPVGWALCNGQILSISQNTALFSLLGTMYGGDGKSNFALPNLQGRVALDSGSGTGLTLRTQGTTGGESNHTLSQSEIPAHAHGVNCDSENATSANPSGNLPGVTERPTYAALPGTQKLNASAVAADGGGVPHNNLQPYLVMNYCIAPQGVFPARS